ncbi:phage major capsid protein [Magnetospirillum molischianum]|uniref:Putative Major capsid protein HK97 n=1 Tax=Magnetospirillum molischianum DSM 120 TaxID=1150626 RepID=H8FWW8_MAGML|nr:phage major capsid protein [Magnetospirillum molischianum]CCG42856.1 putative Major capsid protein HK97 [Magnetospirillum molischianum DSM 120]
MKETATTPHCWQASRFGELRSSLERTEQAISRQTMIDEADRRMQGQPVSGTGDDRFDTECRSYSLLGAIASQVPGLNRDGGREREISQELARRSGRPPQGILVPNVVFEQRVNTTTAPAGGPGSNLIATDHLGGQYIDRLRHALRVGQLGATVLNGLVGNVEIPRLKSSASTGWVAENTALPESDQEHDKVTLSPKHCGTITELSRNTLLQTSPDLETLVRNDFAAILAEAIDRAAVAGTGTDNQPLGILADATVSDVSFNTGAQGLYLTFADMVGEIEDANVAGTMAFLTNTKVKKLAAKLMDANARPLGLDTVFQNQPRAFSNVVPSTLGAGNALSAAIYANWSDLLIGYWSAFDLLVNPFESTAYKKGNVSIRAMLTMDLAKRHPESFAVCKDIAA